jgi:hypothetical protein
VGCGECNTALVVLTPANFYHFRRPKFNLQPLSFIFETCGKKLAKAKIIARVNVKKVKAKKVSSFLTAAEALLKSYK